MGMLQDERRGEQRAMLTLYVRLDQRDALKAIAKERQMAVADVTREAIREYLAADAARRHETVAA